MTDSTTRPPRRHTHRFRELNILDYIRRWPATRQVKRYPPGLMRRLRRKFQKAKP